MARPDADARPRRRPPAARRRARTSRSARWSARRLGDEVVDRLVDPLLGGVYAGRADGCRSPPRCPRWPARPRSRAHPGRRGARGAGGRAPAARRAGLRHRPRRAEPAGRRRSAGAPRRADPPGPAGARAAPAPARGWRLTRRSDPATARPSTPTRWCSRCRPARPPGCSPASTPDAAAERRRAGLRERGAGHAGPAAGHARCRSCPASWCRPTEGTLVKAATFFTTKWAHLRRADGVVLVRASLGRYGEEQRAAAPTTTTLVARPHRRTGRAARRARCRRRSPPGCSAGAARCRSTRPATSTGSPRPGRRCRRTRWRWPARPTTGSASRPACAPARRAADDVLTSTGRMTDGRMSEQTNAARLRELNATIRYTMWSVFRAADAAAGAARRARRRGRRAVRAAGRRRTWWCAAPTTCPACAPTPT